MTFESFMSPSRRATRDPYPHYMTAAEIAAALPGKRTAAEVTRAMQAYTATLVPTPELQWPDGLKRWFFNSVGHAFHIKHPVWMRLWEVWQLNRA